MAPLLTQQSLVGFGGAGDEFGVRGDVGYPPDPS